MSTETAVRIVVVYPQLLGTYGDCGNAIVLRRRCDDRGIDCDVAVVRAGEPVPRAADVYLLGGAEDARQATAARLLIADGGLASAVDRGAAVLGVCAGYQILGAEFSDPAGHRLRGLGLIDAVTAPAEPRAVGDVVVGSAALPGVPALLGFENHSGRTELGSDARPLGAVVLGVGNGDAARTEGAVSDRVIGTYLHGPVLAANPALADHVLREVVGTLPEIDLDAVDARSAAVRRQRLRAATRRAPRRQRRAISRAWFPRPIGPSRS